MRLQFEKKKSFTDARKIYCHGSWGHSRAHISSNGSKYLLKDGTSAWLNKMVHREDGGRPCAALSRCCKTETFCSRADVLRGGGGNKIQVRNTHVCMCTCKHTAKEDHSQVIKTTTSSDSSLKYLPPDWPKSLSNKSSNKSSHICTDMHNMFPCTFLAHMKTPLTFI